MHHANGDVGVGVGPNLAAEPPPKALPTFCKNSITHTYLYGH